MTKDKKTKGPTEVTKTPEVLGDILEDLNSYLKLIKKHKDGLCDKCGVYESIEHFLFECEKYKHVRYILRDLEKETDESRIFKVKLRYVSACNKKL